MTSLPGTKSNLPGIRLRSATLDDAQMLWDLRMEPATRAASQQDSDFSYPHHLKWLKHTLDSPTMAIFILQNTNKVPVGYLRFHRKAAKHAYVSIAVNSKSRGKGIGTAALVWGIRRLFRLWTVEKIVGLIKAENTASQLMVLKAGFTKVGKSQKSGQEILRYEIVSPYLRSLPSSSKVKGSRNDR